MSSPTWRPRPGARRMASSGTRLALSCARNAYRVLDGRMPEAATLADWLSQHAPTLGLPETTFSDSGAFPRHRGVAEAAWRKIGDALTKPGRTRSASANSTAECWIAAIAARVGLDALEARILSLALHYRIDQRIERLFHSLSEARGGITRLHRDVGLIAMLLGAPDADVAARLLAEGKLLASGLLHVDRDAELGVLSQLASLVRRDAAPAEDFYDQLLSAAAVEPLAWNAFAHLGREADVAADLLTAALSSRTPGVNILLYGPPGTGKTSFAATLAGRVGARLRSVGEADDDGDEPQRRERLAALRLAQRLAEPGATVLLFDEAEDVFVRRSMAFDEPVTSSRVYMHRLLETMTIPVIWTANDIGMLGPAVLRRMTMCLELRVPNLATRTVLCRRLGEDHGVLLHDADAARLARLVPAAPAVAATALKATRLVGGGAETARLIVEGVARAVRGGGLPAPEQEPDPQYDPALLHADCDLAELEADLLRPGASRAVSFLLAGPPGTGKSAWVRHLAGRMGLPVLQKRASDLLDPFVGGTEQNIAAAFVEARNTGAFLVFDEADSVLLDRADAVRSWRAPRSTRC